MCGWTHTTDSTTKWFRKTGKSYGGPKVDQYFLIINLKKIYLFYLPKVHTKETTHITYFLNQMKIIMIIGLGDGALEQQTDQNL